ncbi:unnamed protein product, partial [Ectocarpus sp. 8 AP-2014]
MLAAVVSGGFTVLRGAVGLATATAVQTPPLPSHVAMPVLCRARSRHQRWPNGNMLGPSAGFISRLAVDTSSATRVLRACTPLTIAPHGGAEEDFNRSTPPRSTTNNESQEAKARREARFDEEGEYRVFRELLEGKKTRFVSRVMYDGTNYKGFQLQGNGLPTVQRVLEKALSTRFQTYVPVVAAGRTDTGVHSVGQAVHFDLPNANEDLSQLAYSMNQMMPEDVRVWNMSVAPPSSPW